MSSYAGRDQLIQATGCRAAIGALLPDELEPVITLQNAAEFWNVLTRPTQRNGFGLAPPEAEAQLELVDDLFPVLSDPPAVYAEWKRLVAQLGVRGVQVHDAHLVATMSVHSVTRILTFEKADFARYPGITALEPGDLVTPVTS